MLKKLLFLLLFSVLCYGQTFIETGRIGGNGSEPGRFVNPLAVDLSRDGLLYVVDSGNNRIQLFDQRKRFVKTIGGFGFEDDQFDLPSDIWTRSLVNIYVSDYNNRRLVRYDKNMNFISTLLSDDSGDDQFYFDEVISCAVSSQNDLFLLDRGSNKIVKMNRSGQPERVFGTYDSGDGELQEPVQIDIVGNEKIVVSDISRDAILLFDFFGNYLRSIQSEEFNSPSGLAVDKEGQIFVADPGAKKIFIISADFRTVSELSLHLAEPLKQPQDITIGNISRDGKIKTNMYLIDGDQLIFGNLITK